MWSSQSEELADTSGLRVALALDSGLATYSDVIRAWQGDAAFRSQFNALLAEAPYTAFRWETPSVTAATLGQPFEFVLLDSPELVVDPDADAFAEHFIDAPGSVVRFRNLHHDAILIAPCQISSLAAYGHLAAFVRNAPEAQRDALWQLVGHEMSRRVNDEPVWLSTHGAGVSWLHVRLDDRPKYYGFAPYRRRRE